MKKIIFLSAFVLTSALSFSQKKKGSFIFSEGFHSCQNSNAFFDMYSGQSDCPVGEITRTGISQKGGVFFDATILYKQPLKNSRISALLGLGVNQKGYTETGTYTMYGETSRYGYTTQRKITYLALSAGASLELLQIKKVSISLAGLINPEARIYTNMSDSDKGQFRALALSGRSFVDVAYKWRGHTSLHLMPFFQTAIGNYNRSIARYGFSSNNSNTTSYHPYSLGISAGISF